MFAKARAFFTHIWQKLDPRRSLRMRITLTFGLVVILLTVTMVIALEMTAVDETTHPGTLIDQLAWQIWVAGICLTIAFVTIAWIMAGRIVLPLQIIAEAARDQQQDGYEHVIPTFPGQDEVASLSRSLNILVASLKAQQKALREANALLERRVSKRTRQLATLYDVLEIGSEKDALPTLLDRALTRILRESSANAGCIHLIQPNGQQITLVSHFQISEPLLAAYRHVGLDHPVVTQTLQQELYWVVDSAQIVNDDPDLSRLTQQLQILCLPIRRGEQNLGILSVFTQDSSLFKQDEMDLLSSLADQLGIMVENERLRKQAEQLAIVEERNRLARELHDSVTQALYSATLFAEAGQKQARVGQVEKAMSYLDEVLEASRQALKEMRLLVYKLRPSTLEKEGLVTALDQRLKAVEGRAGIEQKLVVHGNLALPAEVAETLYLIAVEALNNALKHARATAVTVTITQTETAVSLQIADNGQGFDRDAAVSGGGFGLTSMQERAILLHGSLTLETAPDQGTAVTAVLPITHPS